MKKCKQCKEPEVVALGLCGKCYRVQYRKKNKEKIKAHLKKRHNESYGAYPREVAFIRNYFTHKNWAFHPAIFRLDIGHYEPDFWDGEAKVFCDHEPKRIAGGAKTLLHFSLRYLLVVDVLG